MEINKLILLIEKKLRDSVPIEDIIVEDRTYLHKNHKTHQLGRMHVRLKIQSLELKKMNKISSTKKIYEILNEEIKNHIHSIEILLT
tara:strand:- start:440 stop:700 length:261 start_codon:yes stop_codon:yes gene_type:complete